jgi:predicted site-specific integrase-resolvase
VVRVAWRDRLARFGVGWIERYLSVCGVSVEALHECGDKSLLEELMDDFMAVLASFSGRFYRVRSRRNQQGLLDAAARRLSEQ